MRIIADLIIISVLTGLSVIYLTHLALSVPAEHALMVNFMLVPVLLGIAAYFLFARSVLRAFPWMVLVPVAHILFLSEMPAKSGLPYWLAAVEFLFICSGIVLASAVWRLMRLSVGKFD